MTTRGAYKPVTAEGYRKVLLDFKVKMKSSPLMQIADLVLWPVCRGGYDASRQPYPLLVERKKLLDCLYPERIDERGVKYSCFEHWRAAQ